MSTASEREAAHKAQAVAFGRYLGAIRGARGESYAKFSKHIGISTAYAQKVENGLVGVPKRSTVEDIADRLEIPAGPLLLAAGYLPAPGTDDPEDVTLTHLFASLSPAQKRLARRLIETVRDTNI